MTSTITDRVYGESASVAVKAPCVAVALTPSLLNGLGAVGSYTPNVNDRILVIAQTDPTTNGIYNASAGAWQRSGDFDGIYDAVQGSLITVFSPNADGSLFFQLTTQNPVIGTTPLIFASFINPTSITYGLALVEFEFGVVPVNLAYPLGDVRRYGAIDDGVTDNAAAFVNVLILAALNIPIYFPKRIANVYLTSVPLLISNTCTVTCDPGVIIKLTAAGPYVMAVQPPGLGGIFNSFIGPFTLDAAGNAPDALLINRVFDSEFDHVKVRNSTANGIHIMLAQSCTFHSLACAPALDPLFTIIPNNGLLADTNESADNIFIDPTFWGLGPGKVGINLVFMVGSLFINGQSEVNGTGIIFGAASSGAAFGNTVFGMDLESNTTVDVLFLATSSTNNLVGPTGGVVTSIGGQNNHIFGGYLGGISFDAASANNTVKDTTLTNVGGPGTITDNGTGNTWSGVYNQSTATVIPDKERRLTVATNLVTTGTVQPNAANCLVIKITYAGAASGAITINNPLNPVDGMVLFIRLHVTGAGSPTFVMGTSFRGPTPTVAATGNNRTAQYVYDQSVNCWYFVDQSSVDVPN